MHPTASVYAAAFHGKGGRGNWWPFKVFCTTAVNSGSSNSSTLSIQILKERVSDGKERENRKTNQLYCCVREQCITRQYWRLQKNKPYPMIHPNSRSVNVTPNLSNPSRNSPSSTPPPSGAVRSVLEMGKMSGKKTIFAFVQENIDDCKKIKHYSSSHVAHSPSSSNARNMSLYDLPSSSIDWNAGRTRSNRPGSNCFLAFTSTHCSSSNPCDLRVYLYLGVTVDLDARQPM